MSHTVTGYLLYLAISVAMTVWVARTLHRNGRIFIVQAFRGNEVMADSVNHLLVVGFYLINVGFITLTLHNGPKPTDVETMIEFISTKVGIVLLVLGAMHFFNVFNFDRMRRKGLRPDHPDTPPGLPRTNWATPNPPVAPTNTPPPVPLR